MLFSLGHSSFSCSQKAVQRNRGARDIITVADVYDSLTSDRPYRKAMSPFEVREILVKGAGTEFDPTVVEAFLAAFRKGEMEMPELVV